MSNLQNSAGKVQKKSTSSLALVGAASLTSAAAWIVYSAALIDHNLPLPLAIESERRFFQSPRAGLLNYYVDDIKEGRPLVLVHSVNAAASAYEMRPIFENFRGRRPVYALDLPGFGFSERSDRYYSPHLFAAAISDFLERVVKEPADVIGLSLSGEFAALAAKNRPQAFHSLVLISPTGLGSASTKQMTDDANGGLLNVFLFPLWSQALFDLLATRASIHYFLKKSFYGTVDEGLASYAYLSAHQPGARYAPLHFISGELFTPDVRQVVYGHLQGPVLIIYDRDAYTGFERLPDLLLAHPNWSAARITPTRGLPQFEQLETCSKVLDNFWQSLAD